ncbi:hypothetical protein AKO1_015564 [Acrasis kona]|uniref:CHCH domain-containing protein n=1 Tax=Acrasis kona TaxID=1008807 RepID=A0AAW2ZHC2_9EUKA
MKTDQEIQDELKDTVCGDFMRKSVTCFENSINLEGCHCLFDDLTKCMKQNNLLCIVDEEWSDNREFYGLPPNKDLNEAPTAP